MTAHRSDSMLYVVSYDIPSDRRRKRVHKTLMGFGLWVQYSVFECFLTKKELLLMRDRLHKQLDPKLDQVRIYPMCDNCLCKVEAVGGGKPAEPTAYIM